VHLDRLVALEYVLVHRGSREQSFVYELSYNGGGKDGGLFLNGLCDVAAPGGGCEYDGPRGRGQEVRTGSSRLVTALQAEDVPSLGGGTGSRGRGAR
jgi:hypothetical protein